MSCVCGLLLLLLQFFLSSFRTGTHSCFLKLCLFWSTSQILILNFFSFFFFFFFLHKELNFGCLQSSTGCTRSMMWASSQDHIGHLLKSHQYKDQSFAISWVSSLELSCCGKSKITKSSQNHLPSVVRKEDWIQLKNRCKDTNHSLWFLSLTRSCKLRSVGRRRTWQQTAWILFKGKKEWIAKFYIKLSYVAKNIKGFLYIYF